MNKEHFTLTISQSTIDATDFAIHIKDDNQPERLLLHLKFASSPVFDETYCDEIVNLIAKKIAKKIIECHIASDDILIPKGKEYDDSATVVHDILAKFQKND